jgi:hypothetical protein
MQGRQYSVKFSAVTVSAAQDLFEILSATDRITKILGWHLMQKSDVGDAAEEILRVLTVRGIGSVTSGSGGTAPTAQPVCDGDSAFGGTPEVNNTTRMAVGSGTLEELEEYGWNVRIPWTHYYTPELCPVIKAGNRWTLALPAAPGDAIDVSGTLWLEEMG